MKNIYFTVGPTKLFPRTKQFLNEAIKSDILSVYHRTDDFTKLFNNTCINLKKLLNIPNNYYIFFPGSATECMDRILQNLVIKSSFHFIHGAFGERFYNTAKELGKKPEFVKADYGKSFDFKNVSIPSHTELICIVQNETSTGVSISESEIKKIKKQNPDKLIAVDIVSSAPYAELDFKYLDCAFFSVQKGFGLPAGLAVLIVNEKCLQKTKLIVKNKSANIGSYHNFIKLSENAVKNQPTETPNTLGIYLLGKITEHFLKYGIEKIRKETDRKAKLLYDYFDKFEFASPFVKNIGNRSNTVIVIESEIKEEIKKILKDNGIIVSDGYGKLKDNQFRIGNFPVQTIAEVKKIISVLKKKFRQQT